MEVPKGMLDTARVSDEDYRQTMSELTRSDGYAMLCGELFAISENLNNLQDISTMEDLHFKRGQLAVIGLILNYQSLMEQDDKEELGNA
tara:strand:- start:2268 stop:2534 length:267 start_codon:yes stop_codon:yes gene_type:complete